MDHVAGGNSFILQEGYSVKRIRKHYKYMITIMASGEKIFPSFVSLSSFIDPSFMAILEDNSDPDVPEVYISKACTIDEALEAFREYEFQLVNDGFISFGLASQRFEVLVESHKEIHVFCNTKQDVQNVIENHGIPKARKLNQMGGVNHIHVSLRAHLHGEDLIVMSDPLPQEEFTKHRTDPEEYENFFQNIVKRLGMVRNTRVVQPVR